MYADSTVEGIRGNTSRMAYTRIIY